MIIKDPIHKVTDIKEPVLRELMHSPSINRLKDVSQYGILDKYYHHKNFSRYEHSVGVMLLLRRLNRPVKEQVAGLLHDVSILAFSHVADWVFGDGKSGSEDYHDSLHSKFVHQSEIPEIIGKYGFSEEDISDISKFSVLDVDIPDLCADRVDYALREFDNWLNPGIVQKYLEAITVNENLMVFNDVNKAFAFASNFLRLQAEHWGFPETAKRYHLFAHILKCGIDSGLFVESDFYGGETPIIQKLESCQDDEIKKGLKILSDPNFPYVNRGEKIFKKFRYVNPLVLVGLETRRLSDLRPEFSELLTKYNGENKLGVEV